MSKHLKLPTILIVSDNPSIRFWVKKHLEDKFFIVSADTKREALNALNASLDFIIIDSEIESCDAIELSHEIYKKTAKTATPIFLITGKLKKTYREKAKKAGVTEFLSANLDLEELMLQIEAGKKSAEVRQKTEEVTRSIKIPAFHSSSPSLKNKFVLTDKALRLLKDAKKKHTPVALLLMHIDSREKIKNFDAATRDFSQFINQLLREKDVLIPSKEKGFILILWNTSIEQAKIIAKRLSEKIKTHNFPSGKMTASIAVSSLEASEEGFHKMLDSAGKSLTTRESTNLIIFVDQEKTI